MNDTVYFKEVPDYDREKVQEAVEYFFQSMPIVKTWTKDTKVLLKPNLLSKSNPDKAITTHPEVVRGVITALKKRGITQITLADSAGGLYNPKQTKALYQGTGMKKMGEEEGIHLYSDCISKEVPVKGKVVSAFTILEPALEADVIINLPKFKTHVMTGMTAGCKNMFGCIPGLEKSQWHTRFPQREPFGDMLIDLYQVLPPTISILDGILAMEGDGPGGGSPRPLGILLSSENTLQLDLAVAEMMGFSGSTIPYLKVAMERGLCPSKFDPALVQGDSALFVPIPQWILPQSYQNGVSADTTFSQFMPKPLRPLGRAIEQKLAPRPVVLTEKCINCKRCSEICSKNAIDFPNDKAKIRKKDCILCFCCHEVCPVKAIDVKKSKVFAAEGKK